MKFFFFQDYNLLHLGVPDTKFYSILVSLAAKIYSVLVSRQPYLTPFQFPQQLFNEYILPARPGPPEQQSGTPKLSKIRLLGTLKCSKIWLSVTPKWSKVWLSGTHKWSKISILKNIKFLFPKFLKLTNILKALALWADAFYKSICSYMG